MDEWINRLRASERERERERDWEREKMKGGGERIEGGDYNKSLVR